MTHRDKTITDEEMADLPDDHELAFVLYEERLRAKTRDVADDARDTSLEREYVNHLLAFIKVANLDIPVDRNPPHVDNVFWSWYDRFLQVIDYHAVEIRVARARGVGSGITTSIYLSGNYRTEIHNLLGRVRKVVNATDLPDDKKNRIYGKVAALELEVDRTKTRFDAFLSRWLDLTNAVGEGAENLEPLVKLLDRVVMVLGRAKADHDTGKLPPPEETRKLPGPSADQASPSDLDDEIPF